LKKLFFAGKSFIGIKLDAVASSEGIRNIFINKDFLQTDLTNLNEVTPEDPLMFNLFKQFDQYFKKEIKEFNLPLDIMGTEFQKRVWAELENIKYGETITYQQLAIRLGDVKSIRAAGRANGANPLPIVIPCHRVIGANGKLVGYGGGLNVKRKLLEIEECLNPDLFA
jgi:methylated-DNA-[protein]-cysteine S-methyltransferase